MIIEKPPRGQEIKLFDANMMIISMRKREKLNYLLYFCGARADYGEKKMHDDERFR